MACVECAERRKRLRDAIFRGKLAEAKDITVEGLRVMIGIDAGADHRKEATARKTKKRAPVVGRAGPEVIIPPAEGNEEQ